MRIAVDRFGALVPRLTPSKLADNQAQKADNVRLLSGSLETWKGTTLVEDLTSQQSIQTVYLFGDQYWFRWPDVVDVVRGPIPDQAGERTYFTGTDKPRWTDSTLALTSGSGGDFPYASRQLGLPAPSTAPTVSLVGATAEDDPSLQDTRSYVYTYVSDIGEEGPPSDPSDLISPYPDQNVDVDVFAPPGGEYVISFIRIYRTSTSSASTAFQFVDQVSAGNVTYRDTREAGNLDAVLETEGWIAPPEDMINLTALPNGVLAGSSGQDVRISVQYAPYAWPLAFRHTPDEEVVALAALDNSLVVLTDKVPYLITGSSPETYTMTKIDGAEHACASKRSVAVMPGYGCVFAGQDGLIAINGASVRNITEAYLERREWQALEPSTMIGVVHEGRYYCAYGTGGEQGMFVFDPQEGDGAFYNLSIDDEISALYRNAEQDALYFVADRDKLRQWNSDNESALAPYVWRSKDFIMPRPVAFSSFQVRAQSYESLTIRFYGEGDLIDEITVTSDAEQRLACAGRYRRWEFEIESTDTVESFQVAEEMMELA